MKLSQIKPNPTNPRSISPDNIDKLVKSIKGFERMMELRPIVIDKDNVIIGGNQRFQAIKKAGYKEVPDSWIVKADDLTDEQRREFIVKDNLNLGIFDMDLLANEYDMDELDDWGLDLPEYLKDSYTEEFALPDGDKEPFQQMTFTLADAQAEVIKSAMDLAKSHNEYKTINTFGNENSNGNALYLIVKQWAQQKTS